MDVKELIKLDMQKVRRDSNLMRLYIDLFTKEMGYAPSCAGCTFSSDWYKLVQKISVKSVTLQKTKKTMATKIEIKRAEGKILSFKDKNGITHRKYDNKLTPEFIEGYLSNGTTEEIENRKKLFKGIPAEKKESKPKKDK